MISYVHTYRLALECLAFARSWHTSLLFLLILRYMGVVFGAWGMRSRSLRPTMYVCMYVCRSIIVPVGNIGDSSDLHPKWNISTHVIALSIRLLEAATTGTYVEPMRCRSTMAIPIVHGSLQVVCFMVIKVWMNICVRERERERRYKIGDHSSPSLGQLFSSLK